MADRHCFALRKLESGGLSNTARCARFPVTMCAGKSLQFALDTNALIHAPKMFGQSRPGDGASSSERSGSSGRRRERDGGWHATIHQAHAAASGTVPAFAGLRGASFRRPVRGSCRATAVRSRKRGEAIGPMDTLIAATVLDHGATLITHNTIKFSRIPGLLIKDWY